eukprot:5326268-Amphidinium_carterae.1
MRTIKKRHSTRMSSQLTCLRLHSQQFLHCSDHYQDCTQHCCQSKLQSQTTAAHPSHAATGSRGRLSLARLLAAQAHRKEATTTPNTEAHVAATHLSSK